VVLVTVLIERDEEVGFVARGENFAGSHANLEDGRSAGDGGGDRHVGHDVLRAAPGQAREESAGALNSVLRISCETDYGVINTFGPEIGTFGSRTGGRGRSGPGRTVRGIGFWQDRRRIHVICTISKARRESTGETRKSESLREQVSNDG
jgi:hypothetical protein